MKAAVFTETGLALDLADLPDPIPASDEVVVRVEACGVCHSDLHLAQGDWPEMFERRVRPTILGHEMVGVVVARGVSVQSIEKGMRVGVGWVSETCGRCELCREGNDNLCESRRVTGVDRRGGWASLAAVHRSQAVPIPAGLDPAEAAPLLCAGVTVYRGMKKAGIRPGQRVAVFGVGGLGHLAVQLAKAGHAETIAVDPGAQQRELAHALGARHVLDTEGAPRAIRVLGGAHVAVVATASVRAYQDAFRSLRSGGTLVALGLPTEPLEFLSGAIALKEVRIVGSAVGSREDVREVLALAGKGSIRCVVERATLGDVDRALARLREGSVRGRIVIVP